MENDLNILYGEFDNVETLLEKEKEKTTDEELNDLFKQIDNFPDELTVVREISPSKPLTVDEKKRRLKGKSVA